MVQTAVYMSTDDVELIRVNGPLTFDTRFLRISRVTKHHKNVPGGKETVTPREVLPQSHHTTTNPIIPLLQKPVFMNS